MTDNQTKGEYALAILRIILGWMFLWAFFDKLFGLGFSTPAGSGMIDGGSPSSFVVYVTGGIFGDLFNNLAGNGFIDILMMLGLLALSISLILGITSKLGTFGAILFCVMMFLLHVPPSDNPIVDYHIVYVIAILAVYWLGGFGRLSLYDKWMSMGIVKRFPILQ